MSPIFDPLKWDPDVEYEDDMYNVVLKIGEISDGTSIVLEMYMTPEEIIMSTTFYKNYLRHTCETPLSFGGPRLGQQCSIQFHHATLYENLKVELEEPIAVSVYVQVKGWNITITYLIATSMYEDEVVHCANMNVPRSS